ncbi:ankyrin repeat protein [Xylariaceae sp. FL0255]|nr:ankyrin repeat protein [Xylariaceae sp. FL0255]
MADDQEVEGASIGEQLIGACRGDNVDLIKDLLAGKDDDTIADLLNNTKTVMGNHLYHEAALNGSYYVIDFLTTQDNFECDPINRVEGDTPLHSAIRWINKDDRDPRHRENGQAIVEIMLEAGSDTRIKNRANLTPLQLVNPSNKDLRELINTHEYATLNAGDFVNSAPAAPPPALPMGAAPPIPNGAGGYSHEEEEEEEEEDDDAEFSGSDEEDRAEWERRRTARK